MTRNIKFILYILICVCIVISHIILISLPYNKTGTIKGMNYNVVSYFTMLIIIYSFFALLVWFLQSHINTINRKTEIIVNATKSKFCTIILHFIFLFCAIGFFILIYYFENTIFPGNCAQVYLRQKVSKPIYVIFLIISFTLYVFFSVKKDGYCVSSLIRKTFGAFFALLCAFCCYAPNLYADPMGNIHHIHAYTNSIVQVAYLQPFSDNNLSIYGHYALLYLPLVKVLGNNYIAIALSVSVFSFITYFSVFCVCEKWIKQDLSYIIAILAIVSISTMIYSQGQYYQVNPHRFLFPAITLYIISFFISHNIAKLPQIVIILIIGTLSIIWNMETGVVSLFVFCAYIIFKDQMSIKKIIYGVLLSGGSIVLAYLIINSYSFLFGADKWMSLHRFIYPIGSADYNVSGLRTELPTVFTVYTVQLCVFSLALFNSLFGKLTRTYINAEYIKSRQIIMCIAISGLGSLVYFVNRAAYWNISISWIQMVVILSIYGSEGIVELRQNKVSHKSQCNNICIYTTGKIIMLLFAFVLGIEGLLGIDRTLEQRVSTTWNLDSLNVFSEQSEGIINHRKVIGMGKGVPELFFQIGLDTNCVLIDWADMNEKNLEDAKKIIIEGNGIPIYINTTLPIVNVLFEQGYQVEEEIQIGDHTFALLLQNE